MAPTFVDFKSAPHGNGFDGTSHGNCLDGAPHSTTALTGPPVATVLMGPPVGMALMSLPGVTVFMATPCGNRVDCLLWQCCWRRPQWCDVVDRGSPYGAMALTVPPVTMASLVLFVEWWHWQPSPLCSQSPMATQWHQCRPQRHNHFDCPVMMVLTSPPVAMAMRAPPVAKKARVLL